MANNDFTSSSRGDDRKTVTEINDLYSMAYEQCQAALAIIDAAAVLCALDRAPAHHDTHPSHNIITGAGYASGLRVMSNTLPKMLEQARTLVGISMNDFGVMHERAVNRLGRSHHD